ncbi:MAG: hypothetical protein KME32_16255 [Mojavia pulchra JT2-VF2]|uniref:Uncharacterized protein n=1 Tax=Mojavia pulchra JT2-VF2 TaxID=287848 RepID=A0A951UGR1_9NOST|nr:hypothetical protein [Mojavia pulchra JT2-VF2]
MRSLHEKTSKLPAKSLLALLLAAFPVYQNKYLQAQMFDDLQDSQFPQPNYTSQNSPLLSPG